MRQLCFAAFESFAADAAEERIPDEAYEFQKCYGCRNTFPKSELDGGFCKDCGQGPAVTSGGKNKSVTGLGRRVLKA